MKENKLKIITPEEALEKFLNWFNSRKRLAFFVAFLAGILTHITMITETIMSQDGLWNSMQYSRPGAWETTLGRWGISLAERFDNFIAIPTVSTISCIFVFAITAIFIVDLFDIKNKVYIIFTSLIIVVTPTLTVTLLYIYTSFAYCLNFLISTLVIWFLYKCKYKKIGFVAAILCFMFSLSIYQSYIGVSIGLCVMMSILDLLKNNKSIKQVFKDILKTVVVVLIGAILYYIVTMIILKVSNLELSVYKGAQNISVLGILTGLKTTIVQAYKDFFKFFLKDTIVYNTNFRREVLYEVFFIATGITTIMSFVSMKEKTNKIKIQKILLISLFIILLPLALNIIDIVAVGTEMYALTSTQMILVIPLAFAIFETISNGVIIKWLAIVSCFAIIGTYYIADNTSYAAIKLTYNQAYSTACRIMDRIETTEGYDPSYPILFGGIIGDYNYPRTSSIYTYTVGSVTLNPTFHGSYSGSIGTWVKFMKVFLGIDVVPCPDDVYNKIATGEEYKQMKNFPDPSSVKIINGIVVVKLTESPELPFK